MTTPSTRTSNRFSTPAAASTAKEFLLAEITPVRMPESESASYQRDRRAICPHAIGRDELVEVAVLAVAEFLHGVRIDPDPARGHEGGDSVIPRLAVDILPVVVWCEPANVLVWACSATTEELVEHPPPGRGMHRRGIGDDAVHVEDDPVVLVRRNHYGNHLALPRSGTRSSTRSTGGWLGANGADHQTRLHAHPLALIPQRVGRCSSSVAIVEPSSLPQLRARSRSPSTSGPDVSVT